MAIQRLYKPLLDRLGLTYPQYLVLNVLWRDDQLPIGHIAERLALEPSTLTPLLKRLEAAGFLRRTRNPENERQVIVALTDAGRALRAQARCLNEALLAASGDTVRALGDLNARIIRLRDAVYARGMDDTDPLSE
ncbi:MarR family transcriptional regulator [Sphingomonas sp. ABOLE]|uniref:MarR family winged helix-turn-helix transcriptional regulator n=1 Tax=Sphingomonas sp. ABOLE TaxID=1985878 RepID=UPI000F7E30E5|nr:MarR family transcriptional regulator [Sphingomonas sp. ABOLE]RSV38825.1 MarR family transcriptional regulator [Sphingomonas sp. ABOLE]